MRNLVLIAASALALAACDNAADNQATADTATADAADAGDGGATPAPAATEGGAAPAGGTANAPATPAAAADDLAGDAWIGKYRGQEGLFLDLSKGSGPREYTLRMDMGDGIQTYTGHADGAVIRFRANGREESLHRATGDQIGLKYLAGKTDCLMVRNAVGFCRYE